MNKYLRLMLVTCAAVACFAAERPGGFHVIGPGGGGAMYHPTFSPSDPQTVLLNCDMTGGYITHDGGRSWRMFNLRGTIQFLLFDPNKPTTMYAEATGLWRSTDNGEHWALLYPKPSNVRGVQMNSDHADEKILAEPEPLGSITALAIDPADSQILYAAAAPSGKQPALFISRDAGETWKQDATLPEKGKHVWVAAHSPLTLVFAGEHGVSVRTDSGVETHNAPTGVTFTDVSAGFDNSVHGTIYATSERGAFVSSDNGASWQKCTLPGEGAHAQAVATSVHHPATAYLSYDHLRLDGSTWMGVAKTTDSGRTWTLVWKESNTAAANIHDAWITARLGPDWGGNPLMLGVADQDPNLAYGTDLGRAMLTQDGGANWTAVYSRKVPGGGWTTTGLDVTTSYGVHFDPFDSKRRFITYTDIGLFRSEDGGQSWTNATDGVPKPWRNTTYWVEFDPKVRGRMWSVNSGTHDLPRPKMWRHRSPQKFKGGVCRSDDGGRTWVKSNAGMPETAPTHILLDPASPENARVLYVAAYGRGVYKSVDGGASWQLKNNGITQSEPFAWRLALAPDHTLYVLVSRRSEDGSIGNSGDGAMYKSTDGGENWTPVSLPAGVNAPNGIAIDPKTPQRLYLAAWARATGLHGEGGGIYLSEDGGQTWHNVLDRDQHVYDVTIDPRDSNKLYAAGFESSAWQSTDRGEHWTRIAGFNFKWAQRVVSDPDNPGSVFVTTFGGSVWQGLVNGAASLLDIVTPELEPGR